jgi:hypothetical protein
MIFAILAIPGLVFAMTAHKYIKLALFTIASVVVAYLCYVFSPMVLEKTTVYHTSYGKPLISAAVGLIFGGLLSLKLLRVGLFCLGGCLGLILGMLVMFSPLQDEVRPSIVHLVCIALVCAYPLWSLTNHAPLLLTVFLPETIFV